MPVLEQVIGNMTEQPNYPSRPWLVVQDATSLVYDDVGSPTYAVIDTSQTLQEQVDVPTVTAT